MRYGSIEMSIIIIKLVRRLSVGYHSWFHVVLQHPDHPMIATQTNLSVRLVAVFLWIGNVMDSRTAMMAQMNQKSVVSLHSSYFVCMCVCARSCLKLC